MKILVIYDGTLNAKKALRYGIGKIRSRGGELTVLQVFDRALFVDYDAGPRAEELARREAAQRLTEARGIVAESGITQARLVEEEGSPEKVVTEYIASHRPDLVLATPQYRSLAGRSSHPVLIIPGTILVPVDSSGTLPSTAALIEEAAATSSRIVLLGIVPVHLYSKEEKTELDKVASDTAAAARSLRDALVERGLAATEVIRSGFPDEEILKAAEELQASLVILPTGSSTPSELTKAASIILDEPENFRWPVFVVPVETPA